MDGAMKHLPSLPLLSREDIKQLRAAKTRQSKYTISGRMRHTQPAPITLRLKDRQIGNS
jgi:hypothetical protein